MSGEEQRERSGTKEHILYRRSLAHHGYDPENKGEKDKGEESVKWNQGGLNLFWTPGDTKVDSGKTRARRAALVNRAKSACDSVPCTDNEQ